MRFAVDATEAPAASAAFLPQSGIAIATSYSTGAQLRYVARRRALADALRHCMHLEVALRSKAECMAAAYQWAFDIGP